MENLLKVKSLIATLREEANKVDENLTSALKKRDELVMAPFPKQELVENLCAAVDAEAEEYKKQFSNHLQYLIRRRGVKRSGINKSPSVIRSLGNYSEISIPALHFYHAEQIKAGIKAMVDALNCAEGIGDKDYEQQLAGLNREIEGLTAQRDEILTELDQIGHAR